MSKTSGDGEGKQTFKASIQDCFGEIHKEEEARFNASQIKLYNAENADAWQKNSKISMKIAKDYMQEIIDQAAKALYEHYIHKKLSKHIIKASY